MNMGHWIGLVLLIAAMVITVAVWRSDVRMRREILNREEREMWRRVLASGESVADTKDQNQEES